MLPVRHPTQQQLLPLYRCSNTERLGAAALKKTHAIPKQQSHADSPPPGERRATYRLNKRMAEMGMCSRREADAWIAQVRASFASVDEAFEQAGRQAPTHPRLSCLNERSRLCVTAIDTSRLRESKPTASTFLL